MKVIYPSFAQPVYFEIPITNSQSTPVQIEVKMKKKPLKRIVKRILKNLGLKNSGSQFANEKTGIKEKSKIKSKGSSLSENIDMFDDDDDFEDEDELFVLTEEERLHYRAIWDPSNAFNVDNRQFMMNNFATQQKQAQLFDYVMGSLSTAALGKGKVTQQLPLSTGVGFDLVSKLSSTRSQKSKRKTLIELDGNEQRTIGFVFQSLKSGGNGISFFDERDGVIFKNEGNKASRASAEKEVSSILKEEEQFFAPLSNPKVCINSHLIQKSKRNESSASSSSSSSSSSTGISSLNSEFEASDSESDSSDSEEGSKGLLHSIVSQPTVTLGKLKDPFGDPINLSPAICPRIIGISFVEKKTLMPMLKSDVVVLPVGHHVDKTIRIHSKEGERVDLKLLLPQMLQTRDLIGGQPPFLKSIAERNEYSDDWANESNEKSKRMNRGGAQMIRDDERLCMTKKVIVSETTTFKGKRIEIEGFSDVKEEQLRETKSNLGPEGLLHEGERTLRQVVTLRCPSPANLPICCHESDTNIEMKQQRMQQYECEAFVDEFNKTTGDLGQTSKKLQRRADGVRPYSFEIALFNDPLCSWLYEIWEIVVYSHPAIHLEAELGAFSNITQKVSEVIVEREKRRDHRLSTALGQRDMDEQSIKEMMNDLLKRCDLKWYPGGEYDSAKVRTIEEVPQEIVQKSIVGNVDLAASEGSRLIMREEEISNLLFTTYIPGNKQILVNFVDQTQGKVEESLIIHCSTTINPQYVPMQYLRTEIPVMHRTWLSLPFSNGNDSISSATSFVVTTDRPDLFEISTKSFSLMPHGVMHIEVKVASRADEGSDVGFIYVPQFRSLEGGSVCGWRLRVIYTKMPSAAANQLLPDSEM
ncbi:uncharacterized protein MONOS_8935 [Monocercomonoides exilis]|uniref:uncharacterized protein n=1 Tax=Monocercomonoides exilis TaxID=2049356 RepID=UPI00355ABE5D|nr:hypothetical protein MONOS_8935 [Monocercomonoides exilis]|eukprot:MONOS_8935.1-p1 / transcript=MONOS_8935.1 / gene=MONOS_8935 / organism=Monocercomonoides_exilis_PA203 / gene_product=unspecified product / transcript_product=unspecified product / location=Mono_scaffold00352:8267-10870(-) / protein_length=868 / sequence_SO=supercontig / SO=protein_coding / is_pseudo=false